MEELELLKLIGEDKKLSAQEKMLYKSIANKYLDNIKDNIYKSSIDLSETYPDITFDQWRIFLRCTPVAKYIRELKKELISDNADELLSKGDRAAVGIKKSISDGMGDYTNSNLILVRVPEKFDFNAKQTKDLTEELVVDGL